LSEDPIGFASSDFNFYRYVGNSAVNLIDPTGLFDMSCYANCIENRRWDLWKYLVPFTPVPKKYVPPYRVPVPSQPWTTPYSVGLYGAGRAGVPKSITGPLRRGGRFVAPTVLIVDGAHDWYLLVDCALECKDNNCE